MIRFNQVAEALVQPLQSWTDSEKQSLKRAIVNVMKVSYCEALLDYGVWNEGTQRIGCMNNRVQDIIKEIMHGDES